MGSTEVFEAFHEEQRPVVNEYLDQFLLSLVEEEESRRKQRSMERFREFVMRGGKRLRPLSVLLGYGAVTGEDPDEEIYRLSLPVEIYHNGTLVQDDFMDQDGTRRGEPALHREVMGEYDDLLPSPSIASRAWNRVKGFLEPGLGSASRHEMAAGGQAITGGNQLDNFADWPVYQSWLLPEEKNDILKILNETGVAVNFGQDLDLAMEQLSIRDVSRAEGVLEPGIGGRVRESLNRGASRLRDTLGEGKVSNGLGRLEQFTDTENELYDEIMEEHGSLVDAYISMIDEKTVELYTASVEIGATLGEATESQKQYLTDAMRDIGRAFQVQDDYLEIEESVEKTGKEPTDIVNGKLTLASISTYESLNAVADVLRGETGRFDIEKLVADSREELEPMLESETYDAAVAEVEDMLERGEEAVHRMLDRGVDLTEYAEDRVMEYMNPDLLRKSRDSVLEDRRNFLSNYGNLPLIGAESSFRQVTEIISDYSYGKEMAEDMLESAKDRLDRGVQEAGLDKGYVEKMKGLADYMLDRSH
ncbi:MAG: polyprenyl synthetase family protein [Candidatus Nanohaloarchaea archaeon]